MNIGLRLSKGFLLGLLLLTQAVIPAEKLSAEAFTEYFAGQVKNAYPEAEVVIAGELAVETSREGSDYGEILSYLDNAFAEYKANPSNLESIIGKHVQTLKPVLLSEKRENSRSDLVPVIKDNRYLKQIQTLMEQRQKDPNKSPQKVYYERLNSELVILYAFDSPGALSFASEDDISEVKVDKSELRQLAIDNLRGRLPDIEREGDDTLSMVVADGNFEASLLLFDDIWNKENFNVKGDIVVFVPSRDAVLVTGSKDREGLKKAIDIIQNNEWPYMISSYGFVRKEDGWARFDP